MKNHLTSKHFSVWKAVLVFVFGIFLCVFPLFSAPTRAKASASDLIRIDAYHTDVTVSFDRSVRVKERITVTFLKDRNAYGEKLTMFYRSLPIENVRYYDISASCAGNAAFSFEVEDNPDVDGFFDINCIGGVEKNKTWVYEIAFTMESGISDANWENGMHIDVIPFGFTVPLHDVSGVVRFPSRVAKENCAAYVGFGAHTPDNGVYELSADGKTLTFSKGLLDLRYNDTYEEWVADGISIEFSMDENFESYFSTRFFTGDVWKIVLGGLVAFGLAVVVCVLTRHKREIVTVVNVKAPDDMNPMQMGKLLDGAIDNEDVTSMIYYFAYKGYLFIDLSDENDPLFIKRVDELPASTKAYEKTLFKGLFRSGNRVRVSDLKEKFCEWVDKARLQVPSVKMYEKKSVLGYILGGVIAVLYAFLSVNILGNARLGATYGYFGGLAVAVPVAIALVLGFVKENYRYKWKAKTKRAVTIGQIAAAAVSTLIFIFFFANHIATEWEKLFVCLFTALSVCATLPALSRNEKYCKSLGQILGFKEFIVVTEEDKIKVMLEENPELYYKVLPYAQVLGVTDEWENKFKNILIEPPTWCTGSEVTLFDYLILDRCMRRAMVIAMTRPQPEGGSRTGRSGGGGSFGGFGGGGFGGGGGGAR